MKKYIYGFIAFTALLLTGCVADATSTQIFWSGVFLIIFGIFACLLGKELDKDPEYRDDINP